MALLNLAPDAKEQDSIAIVLGLTTPEQTDKFSEDLSNKVNELFKKVRSGEFTKNTEVFVFISENFTIEEVISITANTLTEQAMDDPATRLLQALEAAKQG